ncbi:molecular chaperone DnaJ [Candidatus Woesearchaeota archaeon CG10_big_fil_rev_8_21_14_0_10_37_12]|nr:MAG: molecular chaperone DnaJ [Candidatus Woesearchaeota archaeon CG10_big_fil_rev_8_21_14_0_10_37_12]
MTAIKVKGYEFELFRVKDSFNRRAVQFMNQTIESLKKIGVHEDHIEIELEAFALKKAPASALWFVDGHRMYFSYDLAGKFVDNLYVVSKVISLEVAAVINGQKTMQDFISEFSEDENIEEVRKKARETLGLDKDTNDFELIDKKYKELAKEHHPDKDTGNLHLFKEINHAHKVLKRELK